MRLFHVQAEFQRPEERIMYDRVIGAFVSMLMLQKEQIAVFTKSQEVDTAFYVFFQSKYKNSLGFLKRGYKVLF